MSPKVSIIVTAYSDKAQPFLDLCIRSIRNLDYPKECLETIVVGGPDYLPRYDNVKTVRPDLEQWYPPTGLNYGISQASKDSEYYFLINDDVILTNNSLSKLVEVYSQFPQMGLLMPFGNDTQNLPIGLCPIPPVPYRLDEITPIFDELINCEAKFHPGTILITYSLCLYAVLISKDVYEKIGPFDESLIGMDDLDFSMRSHQQMFLNCITYGSLVFHAGGATTEGSWTDELRQKSREIFDKKWS